MSEVSDIMEIPSWCPHSGCCIIWKLKGYMCCGSLSSPSPHNGDFNTHRFCLNNVDDGGEVFDLLINKTDVWWFRRMFNAMFPKAEVSDEAQ